MKSEGSGELHQGSGEVFKLVFDRIQTGIIVIDPEHHTVVDINNHAEKLLGLSRDSIRGQHCNETICPAHKGACPVTDLHTPLQNAERILISASGERIPVLKTVAEAPVGEKTYLIESFVDIRDRKRAEEQKIALLAYLNEALFRIRAPLDLIGNNLSAIAGQAGTGRYSEQELQALVVLQAKNIAAIVATLDTLAAKAKEGNEEIPRGYRDLMAGK